MAGDQRRLAALLFADAVGSSRLMGQDESGTISRLLDHLDSRLAPAVIRRGGRVIRLKGDGALVEFGSAVDALAAAIAFQQAMVEANRDQPVEKAIVFRIGLHLGDVIVEGDDIYGDAVNVAARLESEAPPGGIVVSRALREAVTGRLKVSLHALGELSLKNIERPIRAFRVEWSAEDWPAHAVASGPAAFPVAPAPALTLPDKPSIAVLPFQNMSGDPEQEYFADGISEEIITGLSKLHWFFVIARNSSFAYKGKPVDVKHVAHELAVRYVLEGSVRKGGNRIRITTQLIDATTGNHLWADHHDGDMADVFALQDEITKKVVAAIEPKLLEAEGLRSQSRSPEDLGAWEIVIQANSLFWRMTELESEAAIVMLDKAVKRYPEYAPAHSLLAFMLLVSGHLNLTFAVGSPLARAAELAARAAELDDNDPWAHLALGYVAFMSRRTAESVSEYQRALELNPNFAAAHGYLGWALAFDGQSERAINHLGEAKRMSPHDPQNAIFTIGIAIAHYLAGRYAEAIASCRKAFQQRSGLARGTRIYVASLAEAGQLDEARAALAKMKEVHPALSIAWIESNVPYPPRQMAKFVEGMRKAGLQ